MPMMEEFIPNQRDATMTSNQDLIGRRLRFDWIDSNGRWKSVLGEVTGCVNTAAYNVAYRYGTEVPEDQTVLSQLVWGGIMAFENQRRGGNEDPSLDGWSSHPYLSWLIPDMVSTDKSSLLPCLKLDHGRFGLTITVKQSRIEGADVQRVVLRAKSEYSGVDEYKLKAGQLLDMGVCGRLCNQDKKLRGVSFVKDSVYNFQCSQCATFAGNEAYEFDATNDVTGLLYSQIFPFMKKTCDTVNQNVFLMRDPEGCVHMMLGHTEEAQGDLIVPADDSSEIELFTNSEGTDERADEVLADEEVNNWGESDLLTSAQFLQGLFEEHHDFQPEVLERALTCAVLLHRRARHIEKAVVELDIVISILINKSKAPDAQDLRELFSKEKWDELLERVFQPYEIESASLAAVETSSVETSSQSDELNEVASLAAVETSSVETSSQSDELNEVVSMKWHP